MVTLRCQWTTPQGHPLGNWTWVSYKNLNLGGLRWHLLKLQVKVVLPGESRESVKGKERGLHNSGTASQSPKETDRNREVQRGRRDKSVHSYLKYF